MSYIFYSDEVKDKIDSTGVWKLKKKIEFEDGYFESGTLLKIEQRDFHREDENCCLILTEYTGKENYDSNKSKAFKMVKNDFDTYFKAAASNSEVKKMEQINSYIEYFKHFAKAAILLWVICLPLLNILNLSLGDKTDEFVLSANIGFAICVVGSVIIRAVLADKYSKKIKELENKEKEYENDT